MAATFRTLLFLALAGMFGFAVFVGARTGELPARHGMVVKKSESALIFWFCSALFAMLALGCFGGAVFEIIDALDHDLASRILSAIFAG